ncbi:ATP-binding protein [Pseudomonadota bacterium]
MFRIKMALTIATMLLLILILGATLYWGAQRSNFYFHQSERVHKVLEAYQQLSVETDRYFHQNLSVITFSHSEPKPIVRLDDEKIERAITRLRNAIKEEITYFPENEKQRKEFREAGQVQKLEEIINEIRRLTTEANRLKSVGNGQEASNLMEHIFASLILEQFWPLIDQAVAEEEHDTTLASSEEYKIILQLRRTAIFISLLATVLSIGIGAFLYHRLTGPLNQLLEGTEKAAAGDLGHRLQVKNSDEFGLLAGQFNSMAKSLQQQQTALLASRATLEIEVELRTRELQEANQNLLDIDKSRRQFFADISHELRTPLTIIRGEAEVTLRGKERQPQEYIAVLQQIIELTTQMGKLVEDLLYLARAKTIAMQYEPEEVELNELMFECSHDAESLAKKKQLSIDLQTSDSTVMVFGDRVRLKQLLHILIDNACKYSNQRGKVDLALTSNDHYACLTVSDYGIGIPEDEHESVFERFYRSKEARNLSEHGTGLGLALAKAIVETHRGFIELTSKQGVKTTLTVTLPLTMST